MTAKTNNTITVTINGVKFEGLTFEQAQTLGNMAHANAETKPAKPVRKAPKPAAKATAKPAAKTATKPAAKMTATTKKERNTAKQSAAKYDNSLDSARVTRMVKTATDKFAAAHIEVTTRKQGKWVWVYPCGKSASTGRSAEFKAVKLAKGWKYSPKRAAFYRDFS